MRIAAAAAWLIALWAAPAMASDWRRLEGGPNSTFFADADSMVRDGDFRSIWVRIEFHKTNTKGVKSTKEMWKFDCPDKLLFVRSIAEFSPSGLALTSRSFVETRYDYEPVVPDSLAEEVMSAVCAV